MPPFSLRRWGAMLALFAYTFQLLVSFGHLHAEEVFGPLGHAVEIGSGQTSVAPPHAGASHSTDQDQADTADSCAICAALHMAANGVLPDAILPAALVARQHSVRPQGRVFSLVQPPYLLSVTRAPPSLSV